MPFAVINPFFQFFDNVGEPLDGGTIETYESGTSTPKVTYQDATLTTPNTTTITLNSAGRCSMFVGDGETFKYILKDSSGVTIETKDGVRSPVGTQAGIGALLYPRTDAEIAEGVTPVDYAYQAGNIRRFGAVVDGTTDDSAAIRSALNACPLPGGRIYCDPPGLIKVASTVYIPQRVAALGERGLVLDFYGSTFVGQGNGTGTIFESGTGVTSSATNFGQPDESATSLHYGTVIQGARFTEFGTALRLFNFVQGCSLIDLFSEDGVTAVYCDRCFYLSWKNIQGIHAGLAATDVIFDLNDEINTMTFDGAYANGNGTGIGWQFTGGVKGLHLSRIGAENLTTGMKFTGQILGALITGNYIEGNDTGIDLGTQLKTALVIESNYFNANGVAVTGDAWASGRWGHNQYDTQGSDDNDVSLGSNSNSCDVYTPVTGYQSSAGSGPHTGYTALPSNWTVNETCRLVVSDYYYNEATGAHSVLARMASDRGGDGQVPYHYVGNPNSGQTNNIPFCTTSLQNADDDLRIDTKITYGAFSSSVLFDVYVEDSITAYKVGGRVSFGNTVFRDDATAITVTASDNAGFLRLTLGGFNNISLYNGKVRII